MLRPARKNGRQNLAASGSVQSSSFLSATLCRQEMKARFLRMFLSVRNRSHVGPMASATTVENQKLVSVGSANKRRARRASTTGVSMGMVDFATALLRTVDCHPFGVDQVDGTRNAIVVPRAGLFGRCSESRPCLFEDARHTTSGRTQHRDPSRVGVRVSYSSGAAKALALVRWSRVKEASFDAAGRTRDRLVGGRPGCPLLRNGERAALLLGDKSRSELAFFDRH